MQIRRVLNFRHKQYAYQTRAGGCEIGVGTRCNHWAASREQGVERRRRRGGECRRQQGEGGGGGVAAVLVARLAEVDVIAVVSGRAAAVVVVEAARLARHRLEAARAHKHQHPVLCKNCNDQRLVIDRCVSIAMRCVPALNIRIVREL